MTILSFQDLANAAVAAYSGRDPSFQNRVQYWINFFGHRDVTTLTADDIEDGIDALTQRGKMRPQPRRLADGTRIVTLIPTGQPLAGSSINRMVASLGTVFRELRRMRLLPRGFQTPMRGVSRQPEGEGRTLSVTVDDVRRLVATCRVSRNKQLAALTAMACTTGWRLGSLMNLRWGQIDLKNGFADAERTKNGTPHRTPLLPWVVSELQRIRPLHPQPTDPVFKKVIFRKAWETALKRADLPTTWTFHHTRHIAASILAQSGASVPTIMQALNHKTPMMAMRYSHLNTATLRENLTRAWS
ncbi:site-specific integrase [Candidatus Kaiserbacteria bacterium]|nr:site-specific integrase [Candidatus Kaiserbacteria bacterium]